MGLLIYARDNVAELTHARKRPDKASMGWLIGHLSNASGCYDSGGNPSLPRALWSGEPWHDRSHNKVGVILR